MSARAARLILILVGLILYTTFKAVQLLPEQPLIAVGLSILLFACILSGSIIYRRKSHIFEKFWFKIVSWVGSFAMAFWATFILLSIPADMFVLILKIFGFAAFPIHDLYLGIFGLSILLMGLGFLQVLRGPKIKKISVVIPDLPLDLANLTIAQISDLHVGPTIRMGYVEKVVKKTNALNPDMIVFTGDIIDAHADSVPQHLQSLKNLQPRLGSYYVTGNHEYYWNTLAIIEQLTQVGLNVLNNTNAIVQVGQSQVLVAGVTDPQGAILAGHAPNMVKAASTNITPTFKILLAHRPDAAVEAEKLGFHLQFSGHTHAGQFFPFSLLIGLAHQYIRGLYQRGHLWVHVNPGTGYWGPANRLGIPSEISLITLNVK